jgi:adenylylsulfate kinase-like enzyme
MPNSYVLVSKAMQVQRSYALKPSADSPIVLPGVVWITGLPGVGKTTLARALVDTLFVKTGIRAVHLDGDSMRSALSSFDHTASARRELGLAYQGLAQMLADQGFVVIVSTVSLFWDIHESNRERLIGYCEVFLDIPRENLEAGPRSELYKGSPALDASQTAEFPTHPHIRLELNSEGGRDHWLPSLETALGLDAK